MDVPHSLLSLGKAGLGAAILVPAVAIWASGRFGQDAEREPPAATSPAPRATLPRSETTTLPGLQAPSAPDVAPSPAPTVTVGAGDVTITPAAPAAAVPAPRAGAVVGEPQGLPDPNRTEASPR